MGRDTMSHDSRLTLLVFGVPLAGVAAVVALLALDGWLTALLANL